MIASADFETGKLFLPQLLMSADAAKAAFEVVRTKLDSMETSTASVKRIRLCWRRSKAISTTSAKTL
ncbi:MAG: B12-binding domain-containing protein [Anaeromassilibacillus sp.]